MMIKKIAFSYLKYRCNNKNLLNLQDRMLNFNLNDRKLLIIQNMKIEANQHKFN